MLQCNHEVNLMEEEAHTALCAQYPIHCPHCGYLFLRRELFDHKCLPFLLGLITEQEKRIASQETKTIAQEVSQNKKISTLEWTIENLSRLILNIEEKHMKEIKQLQIEINPIECKRCKKLTIKRTLQTCSKCHNSICGDCAPLCSKCHSYRCISCLITCHNCYLKYCDCYLTRCDKCNTYFCQCIPLVNCVVCKKYFCPSHININFNGLGAVCKECAKQEEHVHKLEIRVISASSTYNSHQLSNILKGDNSHWASKNYGKGAHPLAQDHIILGSKKGSISITKFIIHLSMGQDFTKLEIYIGMQEGIWTFCKTVTQCVQNTIITLPHPIRAKFIKFKLTGVRNFFFMIYEVEMFGFQLAN